VLVRCSMIRREGEIYRPSMSVSLFRAPNSPGHRITAVVNFARDPRTADVVISMPNDVERGTRTSIRQAYTRH